VFGFLLAHGVSVTVAFRIRKERDRVKIKDLISLSGRSVRLMYVSLVLLLAGAFAMTFQLHLWGACGSGVRCALLIVTIIFMIALASPILQDASPRRWSSGPPASAQERRGAGGDPEVAGAGDRRRQSVSYTLFVILYMMVFQKPA
jgi:hypothetical protein